MYEVWLFDPLTGTLYFANRLTSEDELIANVTQFSKIIYFVSEYEAESFNIDPTELTNSDINIPSVHAVGQHDYLGVISYTGMTSCACGIQTTMTYSDHVLTSIQQAYQRILEIDLCEHCGDIVVKDTISWSHYRGPGSRINHCQHTAPYEKDATPENKGQYQMIGKLEN